MGINIRGDKQPYNQESSQQTNHYQAARHSTHTTIHIIHIRARALAIRTQQAKKTVAEARFTRGRALISINFPSIRHDFHRKNFGCWKKLLILHGSSTEAGLCRWQDRGSRIKIWQIEKVFIQVYTFQFSISIHIYEKRNETRCIDCRIACWRAL